MRQNCPIKYQQTKVVIPSINKTFVPLKTSAQLHNYTSNQSLKITNDVYPLQKYIS